MTNKGRNGQLKGEKHINAKLTENQVLEIRKLYPTGNYTQRQLARLFNVNQQTIYQIINRKIWNHL